ncbi:MAG: DUF1566 domain-containing protein, partial [Alphaproteobacteria bacterium]|nr:DUF1566 domain-containing protein [Alphaproteobacteria bacterium]
AYADCSDPAGVAGDMKYNADYAAPQYCDGTTWQSMGYSVQQLIFTDQTGVAVSSTITSNTITLVSTFSNATATCGAGCTAISINGGGFVAGPVTGVEGGDTIAIRQTSSDTGYTTTTATVTVGTTTSAVWSAMTGCYNNTSEIGCLQADGTVYAGLSPDGNVPMYAMPCDLGMTGTHNNCTGTRTTYMWGTFDVATGLTSTTTGKSNTAALIAGWSTYDDSYTIGVPAAQACADQTYGGHSDWYLPALDELNLFWIGTPAAIGGLDTSGSWYWSSTEHNNYNSLFERFSDGNQSFNAKYYLNVVRCVRK